jgi:hypothetical protein
MIPFFCNKCGKDIKYCACPDLEQRYHDRFWRSAIFDAAMEAVRKVRG